MNNNTGEAFAAREAMKVFDSIDGLEQRIEDALYKAWRLGRVEGMREARESMKHAKKIKELSEKVKV